MADHSLTCVSFLLLLLDLGRLDESPVAYDQPRAVISPCAQAVPDRGNRHVLIDQVE